MISLPDILNRLCPEHVIIKQVQDSFNEDLAGAFDRTANLIKAECQITDATIKTNEAMIVCGIAWASAAFHLCDNSIQLDWLVKDGDHLKPNAILCKISGNARSILTAERVALNFLQTLSGTATSVAQYVTAVHGTKVQIMDTRKTIPGLRLAQKYAVRVGGGYNQRLGLYDGVLIKENHIAMCGGVTNAFKYACLMTPVEIPIQVEVETFAQLTEALDIGVQNILLDNMSPTAIKQCVEYTAGRAILEVSGGINLNNILDYAKTGVDRISIGALTKHLSAIDLSLRA